ncbi:MAG: tetratricopeptide repeat protein [Candidatus Zixiibacteriota bacterium]
MRQALVSVTAVIFVALATADSSPLPTFDSLWNYDQPAETEVKFRVLLPLARESGNIAYLAELMTQIARTAGLQQHFGRAHAILDSVEALLPKAGSQPRVRYLLERGRAFNSSQQQERAIPLFTEAWERAQKAGLDGFAVDAAHMLAIATPADQHMNWNKKALALAQKSPDPKARKWQGSLFNNIGWDYFDQEKYDSALDMFQKALAFRQEQNQPVQIRFAKWCVAKTYRVLGRLDTALVIQQVLEKEWSESGEKQDGYVYEELAECLLALNRPDEATPYFAKAYTLLKEDLWLSRDEPERLERLKEMGRVGQ